MKAKPPEKSSGDWTDEERVSAVRRMFREITPRYDLLNHILSGCQDIYWRRVVAGRVPSEAELILDLASGTGDMALALARRTGAKIIGVDFVREMLAVGVEKSMRRGCSGRIAYLTGDALELPFADNIFDAVTIAFGLRNIPDKDRALAEMSRVVKPGGRVFVLEMTFPRNRQAKRFFHWYFKQVIPRLGGLISSRRQAYEYLPESIAGFLTPAQLADRMERAGLTAVRARSLSFGVTCLHEGTVP